LPSSAAIFFYAATANKKEIKSYKTQITPNSKVMRIQKQFKETLQKRKSTIKCGFGDKSSVL